MSDKDILVAAKALISDPAKWVKGVDAATRQPDEDEHADDLETEILGDRAFCFCAGGAIIRAAGGEDPAQGALATFAGATHTEYAFQYNDRPATTHDDVMRAFDLAITAAS